MPLFTIFTALALLQGGILIVGAFALLSRVNSPKGNQTTDTAPAPPSVDAALQFQYECKPFLLTRTELAFLEQLESFVPANIRVFTQVGLRALVEPTTSDFAAANRIGQKHIDFVLCEASTKVLCCIELNDYTHQRADRKSRDTMVRMILSHAKIPLVTFTPAPRYDFRPLATFLPKRVLTYEQKYGPKVRTTNE